MSSLSKLMVSPHIHSGKSTAGIMRDVVISLLPATVAGVLIFGWYSALIVLTAVITTLFSRFACCKIYNLKKPFFDLPTVITGIIFGLILPPALPLWLVVLGSMFVGTLKQLIDIYKIRFINSCLTIRILLSVAFNKIMTNSWASPNGTVGKFVSGLTLEEVDLIASATPLSSTAIKNNLYSLKQLLFGQVAGCIGETFSLLIIIAFLYLILRKVISPVIPLSTVGTVALLSLIFGQNPVYMALSGGLLFGAVFIATNLMTSPKNLLGKLIYGIGCGTITFLIRRFTGLPEGIAIAIFIMNITVPFINLLPDFKFFNLSKPKAE